MPNIEQDNGKPSSSILGLPDDVLLLVVDALCEPHFETGPKSSKECINSMEVCNFSMTNKRLRNLSAAQLFKSVRVCLDPGSDDLERAVDCIERSPTIRSHIKRICVERKTAEHSTDFSPALPSTVPLRLGRLLQRLPKLEHITVAIPVSHIESFRDAWPGAEIVLPGVKSLVLGKQMDWLVPLCPNVISIASNGYRWWTYVEADKACKLRRSYDLIRSAGQAPKLTYFELHERWDTTLLTAVLDTVPDIPHLGLPGGRYGSDILELIPILSRFTQLETLVLAHISLLKTDEELDCGTYWDRPYEEMMRGRRSMEDHQRCWTLARTIFHACKKLRVLWLGNRIKAVAHRDLMGSVSSIEWQWSARTPEARRISWHVIYPSGRGGRCRWVPDDGEMERNDAAMLKRA